MTSRKKICCPMSGPSGSEDQYTEIPEQIQKEIEQAGGFEALGRCIPPEEDLKKKSRIYHALSDPLRLSIIFLLRDQPLCVCVINRFVRIANSKLSYHLNILKEAGLIEGEYHGNWIIYSLTETGKLFTG